MIVFNLNAKFDAVQISSQLMTRFRDGLLFSFWYHYFRCAGVSSQSFHLRSSIDAYYGLYGLTQWMHSQIGLNGTEIAFWRLIRCESNDALREFPTHSAKTCDREDEMILPSAASIIFKIEYYELFCGHCSCCVNGSDESNIPSMTTTNAKWIECIESDRRANDKSLRIGTKSEFITKKLHVHRTRSVSIDALIKQTILTALLHNTNSILYKMRRRRLSLHCVAGKCRFVDASNVMLNVRSLFIVCSTSRKKTTSWFLVVVVVLLFDWRAYIVAVLYCFLGCMDDDEYFQVESDPFSCSFFPTTWKGVQELFLVGASFS